MLSSLLHYKSPRMMEVKMFHHLGLADAAIKTRTITYYWWTKISIGLKFDRHLWHTSVSIFDCRTAHFH